MSIYDSSVLLKDSQGSSGLGGNFSKVKNLSTFIILVNGKKTETHIEVDSKSVTLVGSRGEPLVFYDRTNNSWNAPAAQGNKEITNIILNKLNTDPEFVKAITQSAYLTALNALGGNANQATQITGISPITTTPTVTPAPQGLNGTASQNQPQAGVFANIENLLKPGLKELADLNFTSTNEDKLFENIFLKYPKNILEMHQDTLQITMYNYRAPNRDAFLQVDEDGKPITISPKDIAKKGLRRNSALKKIVGTVILPIPSGIQDSNSVSWGDDNINNLTAAVTAGAIQSPAELGRIVGATDATGALAKYLGGVTLPTQAMKNFAAMTLLGGVGLDNPLFKTALQSYLLKSSGFEVSPETILARGAGVVPNSNLELLFQGPTLRQFQFSWRMSPRSSNEARSVRRIIRVFKQGSAPRKLNSQSGAGAESFFLGTPNVFKLSYKKGNEEISGLNKFKICALTGMNVVYAPDGQWAAYEDSQPVSVTMTLNFQEIEPVYESDYQSTVKTDYSPVGLDDVGY